MATYVRRVVDSSDRDTELYTKNINITDLITSGGHAFVAFEFLVIYKDASRWVRDLIEVPADSVSIIGGQVFRESLTQYVEEQREKLRNRSAKLSVWRG